MSLTKLSTILEHSQDCAYYAGDHILVYIVCVSPVLLSGRGFDSVVTPACACCAVWKEPRASLPEMLTVPTLSGCRMPLLVAWSAWPSLPRLARLFASEPPALTCRCSSQQ